jgi:shikimate kinase
MPARADPVPIKLTDSVNEPPGPVPIILTGFMGSGKTTVGRSLAEYYQCEFIDTDKRIEDEQKKSVAEIFAAAGEEFFRRLETELLVTLTNDERKAGIITVGGGMPLREENRRLLKQLGKVVYLKASAETIYQRLKDDNARPLLNVADPRREIEEMLARRTPVYAAMADFTVDTDERPLDQVAEEIFQVLADRLENENEKLERIALFQQRNL